MWRSSEGKKQVPVAGVVLRQEAGSLVIKARIEGMLKEVSVDPREVVGR
jgi:hypothetical protein